MAPRYQNPNNLKDYMLDPPEDDDPPLDEDGNEITRESQEPDWDGITKDRGI